MKNLLLLMLLVFTVPAAFCQTITFNDLFRFLNEKTETDYIHARGFKEYGSQTTSGHTVTFYTINSQSPKTETLTMGYGITKKNGSFLHEVGYTTQDASAANLLIKEINQAGFTLKHRRPGIKSDVYRFEKDDLFVQVVISHQNAFPNQFNIDYKNF